MNILAFRSDPRFAACLSAFLVTGKTNNPIKDSFNRDLLSQNKTGYWKIKKGRIRVGDAVFLLLPNQSRGDGYPRELYAGVVSSILPHPPDCTVLKVRKFFRLNDIQTRISDFLQSRTPPQGNKALQVWGTPSLQFPEEISGDSTYSEGAAKKILVNAYERSDEAVSDCKAHYGTVCIVCGFDFCKVYGELGRGYIHVHHLIQLADIAKDYKVDPVKDLRPVCPNCHSMLHQRRPPLSIDELKKAIGRS